jgi:hypothetical protein
MPQLGSATAAGTQRNNHCKQQHRQNIVDDRRTQDSPRT